MGDMCGVGEIDQDVHTKELKALHFLHLKSTLLSCFLLGLSPDYCDNITQ